MIKMQGGYLPKIAGRPAAELEEISCPEILSLNLTRQDLEYVPAIESGSSVTKGQSLASADIDGGTIHLPAPAAGVVTIEEDDEKAARISLKCAKDQGANALKPVDEQADGGAIRKALADGGVWQSIWSSASQGIPSLAASEKPQAIVINLSLTEPFRPSSGTVLKALQSGIAKGVELLPRLLADGGKLEIIYTDEASDALGKMKELCGDKARFHQAPARYPIENPQVASKALVKEEDSIAKDATIWVIDLQTVAAIGDCLSQGIPLSRRIIAVGGPSIESPKHFMATIGTPIANIIRENNDNLMILKGGLFNGTPADQKVDAVGYNDDALFAMPSVGKREFASFINPGFNRRSIYPSFISLLTGAPDSHLTGTIRGEHRPCIACSSCEKVCPVDIMPQAVHRLLHSEEYDDAEAMGLNRCVDCGVCTYVCPSKIDLNTEFAEAKRIIKAETETALAVAGDTGKAKKASE